MWLRHPVFLLLFMPLRRRACVSKCPFRVKDARPTHAPPFLWTWWCHNRRNFFQFTRIVFDSVIQWFRYGSWVSQWILLNTMSLESLQGVSSTYTVGSKVAVTVASGSSHPSHYGHDCFTGAPWGNLLKRCMNVRETWKLQLHWMVKTFDCRIYLCYSSHQKCDLGLVLAV